MADISTFPETAAATKAALFVNAKARRGQEWFLEAKDRLASSGLDLVQAELFRDWRRMGEQVQKAVRSDLPLVICGGGDGTFSAVARHFVGGNSTLGVLPLGTGNALARDLGIAPNIKSACDVIVNGKREMIDLGFAGDDFFVNVATVGLSTMIATELTGDAKRKLGRLVYAVALVHALSKTKAFEVELTTPEGVQRFKCLQLVIGNGRYHAGPFPLAPNASITEGKLDIYALATTNRWAFLKLGWYLARGRQDDLPEVHSLNTTGGTLKTVPSQRVTVDGEINFRTPLKFGIRPKALAVMVPQEFAG